MKPLKVAAVVAAVTVGGILARRFGYMGPFDAWPSGGGGFEHFYGSWVGRPTSGPRRSTRTGSPWSRTGPPRRGTTSPRT
jgi:hypothetical protein